MGAAIFALALIAAIGVWTMVFSASGGYAFGAVVATPVSALSALGSFWITRRGQMSGLWGILGVLCGILYPAIVWGALLLIYGAPVGD